MQTYVKNYKKLTDKELRYTMRKLKNFIAEQQMNYKREFISYENLMDNISEKIAELDINRYAIIMSNKEIRFYNNVGLTNKFRIPKYAAYDQDDYPDKEDLILEEIENTLEEKEILDERIEGKSLGWCLQ